ncbi:MAG: glycosyltransferase family 4 protein [Desulfobacteraceae bacterium]|nr:glycosyltransferase family 4 protein [Desulfobacteraceae bacterium]
MNILIVHQYYLHKNWPGGSRWNRFAEYWAQRGHEVTILAGMLDIVTSTKPAEYRGKFVVTEKDAPRVTVKRCHVSESYNKSFVGRAWAYLSFVVSSIWVGLFVPKADIIICSSPPLTVGLTGIILSTLKRIPMIFEVRDLWPESAIDTKVLTNELFIKVGFWLEKISYSNAAWINVLTPAFKDVLISRKGIEPGKISVIPNGADLDIIKPGPKNNWVREKYGFGNKFVVTYVGAHGRANALMQLIEAATLLKNRDPDVQIMLVGDGMEKPKLLEAAAEAGLDNVTFVDAVPKSQICDYINASDVCTAVLKKCDTFKTVYPNKVFDYMSAGKPVIIGIDGVARQLVAQADIGIYAEPENPAAFADAVGTLKHDSNRMDKCMLNGIRFVKEKFSREALSNEYLDIIEKIVACLAPNTR